MRLSRTKIIHIAVAAALVVLVRIFLPVVNGLTPEGRDFLSVFLGMVYLWITVDTFVSSVLALAMFGLFQVMPSADIFRSSIGNASLMILLFSNLLICAVGESGALKRATQWFLTRRLVEGRPYAFLLIIGVASFVLSAMISATYMILVLIPLAHEICSSVGCKKGDKLYVSVMLLCMWSSIAGGAAFPFGKIMYITLLGTLSAFNIQMGFLDVFLYALPFGVLWFLCGLAVVRFVLRPDVRPFKNYDPEVIRADMRANPMPRQAIILSCGLILMMVLWVCSSFGAFWPFAAYLDKVGYHFIALAIFAVCCLLQVGGEPVVNIRHICSKNNWACSFSAQ